MIQETGYVEASRVPWSPNPTHVSILINLTDADSVFLIITRSILSTADTSLRNSTWGEEVVVPCRTTAMLASVFVGCGVVAVALTAAFTDKIRLFVYQVSLI